MSASSAVKSYFESQAISVDTMPLAALPPFDKHRRLRALLCEDAKGRLLVVVPYYDFLYLDILRAVSKRSLQPVYASEQPAALADFEVLDLAPMGALLNIPTLMHDGIPRDGKLYFTGADSTTLVSIDASALHAAQYKVSYGDISQELNPAWLAQRQGL